MTMLSYLGAIGAAQREAMAEGRTRMVTATIQKMELYGCAAKAGRAAA